MANKIEQARKRWPAVDRVLRIQDHYGDVNGNLLAGGITYFGFLSFFPILALGFAAVGYLTWLYPEAETDLVEAIQQVLPGIVSEQPSPGTISIDQIQGSAAAVGIIGLAGVLYAGLGWVTALREGLTATFDDAEADSPNFVKGKLTDLVMLMGLGTVLIASVAVSSVITGFADLITSAVGLTGPIGGILLWLLGVVLGVAASTVLFASMYAFLATSGLRRSILWRGALLAAVGFELLKLLAVYIAASASGSAFAPIALSITLLVWINYFARLAIYGASWCATTRDNMSADESGDV